MSRRSARLASVGYYNSDEESDSSSVTNISYHEHPVRALKRAGNRKAGSRTPSRASSDASSTNTEPAVSTDQHEGPTPPPTRHPEQTAAYTSTATPRPALNPTSTRIRTPTAPQERSPLSDLHSSSRPGLHHRLHGNEPSQNNVDSSGYSSSEGSYRKPAAATGDTGTVSSVSGAPSAGHSSSSSSSLGLPLRGMANASVSNRVKKALGLFLLLLILIILSVWLLLPLLTPLISRTTVTGTPPQTEPQGQPVSPAFAPPPPSAVHTAPVVDPAVVSAVLDEKMQHLMKELLMKQESLLSQMEERVLLDMMDMRAQLKAADSDGRLRLEKEVAVLSGQIAAYQSGSHTAGASLDLRIQAVEAQNAKLSQELSDVQLTPLPDPNPDPSPAPPHNQLTPELQQAVEKWLADHIKEQDLIRFGEKGSCSDLGRPMADKMADFALESQGASVVSTRCSETYYIRSACLTLFGFPLWYPSESPRTVIQGSPALLPGKCWAFHGVQGTLVISLSHPVRMTHVTLDHLPRYAAPTGRIDSAPKDFEVYGMINDSGEGALLGKFTYNQDGESTQTFPLPNPSDAVYRFVELRILSNWGQVEYTCIYRFRVHGKIAST